MPSMINRAIHKSRTVLGHAWNDRRIQELAAQVSRNTPPLGPQQSAATQPVVFFNASTRLSGVSLNAAFSLLSSWSLRLQGVPVVHFVCRQALAPCVLGTQRNSPTQPPPCQECLAQSKVIYAGQAVRWLESVPLPSLVHDLSLLDLDGLSRFTYDGLPLGQMVLPSLRWILRRHHLKDNEATRYLMRQYIYSAAGIARQFSAYLSETTPRAVVVFNGMFYPEATVRALAQRAKIPCITHEVGLLPFTAFFTPGEATAYPLDIPADFQLDDAQNERLDAYLEQRFKGNFSMAGVEFWPDMQTLDEDFWETANQFKQIVPIFTNVVFDTSQGHANTVFPTMFAWLDSILELMRMHPDTYFVIRAHPDENRPGKESRESVEDWVERRGIKELPNVLFVGPNQPFSSYELIQHAKFVLIYNSTIGLEASIMGAAVLSGGRARFTQLPTVFFPQSQAEFIRTARSFLLAEAVPPPEEHRLNARRFLYYQLFRSSLPFGDFLEEDGIWKGYVRLKKWEWQALLPERSATLRVISSGILNGTPFFMEE